MCYLIQLKSLFSKENISEIENNVEISNLKFLKIDTRNDLIKT